MDTIQQTSVEEHDGAIEYASGDCLFGMECVIESGTVLTLCDLRQHNPHGIERAGSLFD
jgi:hypothetical protein